MSLGPFKITRAAHSQVSRRMMCTTISKVTFAEDSFGYQLGDKKAPAVVMLQEYAIHGPSYRFSSSEVLRWWGITDEVKRQAAILAERTGFQVIIPDLYKGKLGVTVEEANHNMESLDFPKAVEEICQASEFLTDGGAPAIGVTGFCMGGALSLLAAQHCPKLICAAPFYGTPGAPAPFWDPKSVGNKPVQMHFGENDAMEGFSDPAAATSVRDQLAAAGTPVELHMYPGAGHGFMNTTPWPFDTYEAKHEAVPIGGFAKTDAATHELAWTRVSKFFKQHLG